MTEREVDQEILLAADGGGLQFLGAEEASDPLVDATPGTDQADQRLRLRTFIGRRRTPEFESLQPVRVDLLPVRVDQRRDRRIADLAPQQTPLASDLLACEQEQLLVHGVAEHEADPRCHGNRVRAQGCFDIAPQLVLRVVLLERVPLRSDAVLVRGELLPLALVAEHDADDQHLARQREGTLERLVGVRAHPR